MIDSPRTLFLYTFEKNRNNEYEIVKYEIIPEIETSNGFYLDKEVQKQIFDYGFFSNPILRTTLDQVITSWSNGICTMLSLNGENQQFFIESINEKLSETIKEKENDLNQLKSKHREITELMKIYNNSELVEDPELY